MRMGAAYITALITQEGPGAGFYVYDNESSV